MKWMVGLGNPGSQYSKTRHNAGFLAIDHFAQKQGIRLKPGKFKAEIGEGAVRGEKVFLIKPLTYMNLSGDALRAFMDFYKAGAEDLIVIYDDLDTAFGKIRLRYQGSSGGHNGIKSIIQHLGTEKFNRVRIGISRPEPGMDIVDYVLSHFPKSQERVLQDVLEHTSEALEDALDQPFDKVMAKYNQA